MPTREIELVRHAPRVRRLTVRRIRKPAPRYRLVTLEGQELSDLESPSPTDHVGIIPPAATGELVLPRVEDGRLRWPDPRPAMREFTVRRFDPTTLELDVRFLVHGSGAVSGWADRARPGDEVGVVGPLVSKVMPDGYPNYLLAGDDRAGHDHEAPLDADRERPSRPARVARTWSGASMRQMKPPLSSDTWSARRPPR